MKFAANCRLCSRCFKARSIVALELVLVAHVKSCRGRAKKQRDRELARQAQPSLPLGGNA